MSLLLTFCILQALSKPAGQSSTLGYTHRRIVHVSTRACCSPSSKSLSDFDIKRLEPNDQITLNKILSNLSVGNVDLAFGRTHVIPFLDNSSFPLLCGSPVIDVGGHGECLPASFLVALCKQLGITPSKYSLAYLMAITVSYLDRNYDLPAPLIVQEMAGDRYQKFTWNDSIKYTHTENTFKSKTDYIARVASPVVSKVWWTVIELSAMVFAWNEHSSQKVHSSVLVITRNEKSGRFSNSISTYTPIIGGGEFNSVPVVLVISGNHYLHLDLPHSHVSND